MPRVFMGVPDGGCEKRGEDQTWRVIRMNGNAVSSKVMAASARRAVRLLASRIRSIGNNSRHGSNSLGRINQHGNISHPCRKAPVVMRDGRAARIMARHSAA